MRIVWTESSCTGESVAVAVIFSRFASASGASASAGSGSGSVSSSILTFTEPLSVYLIALLMTLSMTWRTRISSPWKRTGRSSAALKSYARPLSFARGLVMLMRSLMTEQISKSTRISSALPDSILLKSRISLMIASSMFPADLMSEAYFVIFALSPDSRRIISSMPRMPFRGVLISWDMLARKSSLALLALTAWFAVRRMPISCLIVWIMAQTMKPRSPRDMKSPEKM